MKNIITPIILFLLFWTQTASCQEFLVARVLTVDPETLQLTVESATDPGNTMVVQVAAVNDLPSSGGQIFLPECATPDAMIRLWGSRAQTEDSPFVATDIRGCGNGGCSDPTGIRSRLRKNRTYQHTSAEEGLNRSGTGMRGEGGHGGGQARGNSDASNGGGGNGGGGNGGGGNGGGGGNR